LQIQRPAVRSHPRRELSSSASNIVQPYSTFRTDARAADALLDGAHVFADKSDGPIPLLKLRK